MIYYNGNTKRTKVIVGICYCCCCDSCKYSLNSYITENFIGNLNNNMKKQLKKVGTDGLMIYFTKEEQKIYGLKEGGIVDLDDMVVKKS